MKLIRRRKPKKGVLDQDIPLAPTATAPSSFSVKKFETLASFRTALNESRTALSGWTDSASQITIREADEKVEATWARFREASEYFTVADYATMEDACISQKKLVVQWARGDSPKDIVLADRAFGVANDRLGEILDQMGS